MSNHSNADNMRVQSAKSRIVVGAMDQALSSLQNFLLLLLVARSVSQSDFGAFGVAFAIYTLLITFEQSLLGDVLLISHSDTAKAKSQGRAVASTVSAAAVFSAVAAAGVCAAAILFAAPLRQLLLALAITLPALTIHDALRFGYLARGSAWGALKLDALWVLLWLIGVASIYGSHSPAAMWLAWARPCFVTCIYGLLSQRLRPASAKAAWGHVFSARHLSLPLLADFAVTGALAQVVSLLLAAVLGLASWGGLRAAQSLFGPINTLTNACRIVFVPELVRARGDQSRRSLTRRLNSFVLAVVVPVSTVAVLLPTEVGVAVLGQVWALARPLLLPVAVDRLVGAAGVAPSAALRATGKTASLAKIRVVSSVTILIAVVPGLLNKSVTACAWGLVVGSSVSTAGNWGAWRRHVGFREER
jgi:O-antigen/teichoic acid export membrane protein